MVTRQRGTRGRLDALEIAFDDERVVADAGLILPATLCDRLGAAGLIDGLIERPGDRRRRKGPVGRLRDAGRRGLDR